MYELIIRNRITKEIHTLRFKTYGAAYFYNDKLTRLGFKSRLVAL